MTNPTQPAEGMPERWQLVPVEPTKEMIEHAAGAARVYLQSTGGNSPAVIYRAALAAAPKAPPMPDEVRHGLKCLAAAANYPRRMKDGPPLMALLDWLAAHGFTKEE